ncbi:DUF6578 domain-containing protein [Microbacterium sp. JZ101]
MVDVRVGGWEHECCGEAIRRGDHVRWTCVRNGERLHEVHHDRDGIAVVEVVGTVADLRVRAASGELVRIDRVPDGRALRGVDEGDVSVLRDADTGTPIEVRDTEFIVTVREQNP